MRLPFSIQKKTYSTKLENIYNKSEIYLYSYARYAFHEALKTLNIKSIYMPAFICEEVLSIINILNIRYYFYDINELLEPDLKDIKCDAVLAVNYFGFAQNMQPFFEYKRKFDSIIIEDNAHGLFSRDAEGVLLGTRGDIGLLSLRKTIFLPNGACLLINNDKYKHIGFKKAEIKATHEDSHYYKKLIFKRLTIKYIGILYFIIRRSSCLIKISQLIRNVNDGSKKCNLPNKYLTPILSNNLIYINIKLEIKDRRDMFLMIEKWAKKFGIKPIKKLDDYTVPYVFPFIDNSKCNKFEKFLLKKGFYITSWPKLFDEGKNYKFFYYNVKVVNFLW